ncbi:hypothetical protein [Dysosmobacter sp.]
MNRSFRAAVFLCLSALLLTLTAFADMGPKAQLIVRVTDKPEEPYYLDLLAQDSGGSLHESLSGEERAALDPALYRALLSAVPEGWHACLAQGTSGAPIWSREGLAGEDGVHTFYYHGVPRTYRILIVTQSGETFLSEVYTRSALQSSAAVDWSHRTVSTPPVFVGYGLELFSTLVPTLALEGALLWLFGLWSRRNGLVFLVVNLATQLGVFLTLGITAIHEGVGFGYYLLFLPLEAVILAVETLVYRRAFTGCTRRRATAYGIAANLCSAAAGYFAAEPVWRFIVSIS